MHLRCILEYVFNVVVLELILLLLVGFYAFKTLGTGRTLSRYKPELSNLWRMREHSLQVTSSGWQALLSPGDVEEALF